MTRSDSGAMITVYKVHEGAVEPHELAVAEAARVLATGGLALIPTETVYGVAASVAAFSQGSIVPNEEALGALGSYEGTGAVCVAVPSTSDDGAARPLLAATPAHDRTACDSGSCIAAAVPCGVDSARNLGGAPAAARPKVARPFIARPTAESIPEPPLDPSARVNGAAVPALGTGYRRIFTLKQRDLAQTVAWLVEDERALSAYGIDVPPEAEALARAFWPGALTIIVKAAPCVPAFMQAADGTVALRASASPVAQALVRTAGPLACTSSNTHGKPAPASFGAVEPRIIAGVDIAIDACETPCRDASTIVSFVHGELRILRQGALAEADIRAALAGTPTPKATDPTDPQR